MSKTILYSPTGYHLFVNTFAAIAKEVRDKDPKARQIILFSFFLRKFTESDFVHLEQIKQLDLFEIIIACKIQDPHIINKYQYFFYEYTNEQALREHLHIEKQSNPQILLNTKKNFLDIARTKKFKLLIATTKILKNARLFNFLKIIITISIIYFFKSLNISFRIMRKIKTTLINWRRVILDFFNYQFILTSPITKLFRIYRRLFTHVDEYEEYFTFFKSLNPDYTIFGSDQGERDNLYQIECLEQIQKKIFIISICDIEKRKKNLRTNHLIVKILHKLNSKWTRYIAASIYKGNIIGSYSNKTQIFTTTQQMANKIKENIRIDNSRIQQVILPLSEPNLKNNQKAFSELNLHTQHLPMITFFTENLRPIYGEKHEVQFFTSLQDIFEKTVSKGCRICIKLHPHESVETRTLLQNLFTNPQIHITHDIDYRILLNISKVSIAHFSRVLLEGALRDKLIVSLNLNDDTRSFIPTSHKDGIEIQTLNQFEKHLLELIENPQYEQETLKKITNLKKLLQGDTNKKMSDFIA